MNAPTKPKRSHEQVMAAAAEVVFDHWIEHSEGMTVADITAATLHRHVSKYGGCPRQCSMATVRRSMHSKNYAQIVIRESNVTSWEPSGSYIRERLKWQRARLRTSEGK